MRRHGHLTSALAATVVLVAAAGCSGSGPITLPTAVPSVSLSSATVPTLTLPTNTRSTETASETPVETPAAPPSPSTSETAAERPTATRPGATETATETATVTQTNTATVTKTGTATVTQTNTATVTQTNTATVTQTNTVTVSPSTSATPTPSETTAVQPAPAPTADAGVVWWPWVLVALAALGALGWLLLRRRRAQEVLAAWDARLDAAEAEASWVEDALTSQVLSTPTTDEAQTIWSAAQPRLLAIDESIHGLVTDAPDEERAAAATALRQQLGHLVDAVGAEVASGPSTNADDFRTRRTAIDAARHELRQTLGPVRPPAPPPGSAPA